MTKKTRASMVQVIDLPIRKEEKKPYIDDDIFFSQGRVRIGTKLRNVGMRESGTVWRVVFIHSRFVTDKPGQYELRDVEIVRQLRDILTLTRGRKMRKVPFGQTKYSAIWRLA